MITNTLFVGLFCQVQHYLGGGEGAIDGSIIDRFITAPISNNLDVFSQFVFAVCGMMGLLGGLRIYNMAMNGEDEVKRHAFRWLGAIIALFVIGYALQSIASTQQPMQADSNVRDFMEKQ
jgi:TRAP-type C4-dicarboxylate transport system permease small subunit